MFSVDDTIVAIATPGGRGGIGVVRISGPQSAADRDGADPAPARARAQARDLRALSRRCRRRRHRRSGHPHLLSRRRTPTPARTSSRSAGTEARCCCARSSSRRWREGARLAEPGEFTLRAFLHGRIDLVQAEAVRDLDRRGDAAAGARRVRSARRHAHGRDRARRRAGSSTCRCVWRRRSISRRGLSLRRVGRRGARDRGHHRTSWTRCSATAARGRLIREGLHVVLAGRPNAGKSSLFNCLAGAGPRDRHRHPGHDARSGDRNGRRRAAFR